MSRLLQLECGLLLLTDFLLIGAATGKGATRLWIHWAGDIAFQDDALALQADLGNGNCRKQGLRIRVHGPTEDQVMICYLHDGAEVHDGNAVRNMFHHR